MITNGVPEFLIPTRRVKDNLRINLHFACGVVMAIEFHDVEVGVLSSFEHVIVKNESGTVEVVVPHLLHAEVTCIQFPENFRLWTSVGRNDVEVVVTRTFVGKRESIGICRHRTFGEIASFEWFDEVVARCRVNPVKSVVVSAE